MVTLLCETEIWYDGVDPIYLIYRSERGPKREHQNKPDKQRLFSSKLVPKDPFVKSALISFDSIAKQTPY